MGVQPEISDQVRLRQTVRQVGPERPARLSRPALPAHAPPPPRHSEPLTWVMLMPKEEDTNLPRRWNPLRSHPRVARDSLRIPTL